MQRKGGDLAARLKAALDADHVEQERATEERDRRLAEGRAAREDVLNDLEAFGRAVGHVAVQRDADGLTLRRGDRFLRFEPQGDGDRLRVTFEGGEKGDHRLYREPMLRDRWVWGFNRRGREERLPLFDLGLEELAVLALGLPRVTDDDAAPAPQPLRAPARARTPEPAPERDEDGAPKKRDL